jgi:hypothetical protein
MSCRTNYKLYLNIISLLILFVVLCKIHKSNFQICLEALPEIINKTYNFVSGNVTF